MEEWIKKSDAIEAIHTYWIKRFETLPVDRDNNYLIDRYLEHNKVLCNLIKSIPSADIDLSEYSDRLWRNACERGKADRPNGEWIDMGDFEQCSACKGTRLKEFQSYYGKVTWVKTPYCPNCGARMKGADDE